MVTIRRKSPWSGRIHERDIEVNPLEFDNWKYYWDLGDTSIKPLHAAFPKLSACDREFLFSGVTPEEWALDAVNSERGETGRLGPVTHPEEFTDEYWEFSLGITQRSKVVQL